MKKSSSTLPYPTLPCLRILSVESLSKSLILTFCFTLGSTFTSAQICRLEKSCRDISGPVFLDSPTLCESVTGFDPDYTIRNNAHASYLPYSIWDSTTAFNNVDIYIEGLFYIDEPIYFKDCRIKMASGAQIIVTSQAFKDDLMAFRSKFFSCDSMWKGIVLEEGTRCRLFKCTIEDAQYALTVDEYVSLALYGNTFNRNFVSIVNADGNTTLPFLLFKNNTFDCTSALSDYYDLDFTCCFEDPVSFAGILLNDCSASIGYFGSMNRFKSMNYGIFANASTINVKGCEFYNAQEGTIIPDLVQDYPIPGCGIAAYNSVVYIVGDEGVVSSKFDNADVIVNGSSLELKYGLFLESNVVADENLTGETVDIEYCKFQGDDDPSTISVKRSMASGEDFHTIINYDTITNLYPERFPLAAIHLNGVQDPTDFADVSGNVIKSAGIPYSAIRFTVGYSENNLINNNYIQWTNTDDRIIGIRAFLGRTYGSIISSDTIIGGSTIDVIHDSYGISSELVSMDMRYCANYIKNVGYCHAIRGACGGLNNISLNEYDYSGVGLDIGLYDSIPGVSGIQTGTRNKWLMDSTGYLLNTARNTNTNLDINGYYISSNDFSNLLYNPPKKSPSTNWFRSYNGSLNLCGEASRFVDAFDSLIINSALEYEELSEPTRFYLKKNLIGKLLEDEDFAMEYSDFLDDEDDESEYLLANVEIEMKKAMQMDLADQDDLDNILDTIRFLFDSIFVYDAYNYANIDSVTFTEGFYFDSLYSKTTQISDYAGLSSAIRATRYTALVSDLSDVQILIDAIVPRANYDSSYVTIYTKVIDKITNGYLTPAELDDLNEIAQSAGDKSLANLTAFAWFDLCSASGYPEYLFNCEEELVYEGDRYDARRVNLNGTTITGRLAPDSNGFIEESTTPSTDFVLYDALGRIIGAWPFQGDFKESVYSQDMPLGIYFYTVLDKATRQVISSGKIMIKE